MFLINSAKYKSLSINKKMKLSHMNIYRKLKYLNGISKSYFLVGKLNVNNLYSFPH